MGHQSQPTSSLLPPGAWDTHHHVFDPVAFPYSPTRHLTPPSASIAHYCAFKRSLGIANSTVVHGLSYGHDCRSLIHFLHDLQAPGVAVISRQTTDSELASLHAAGVRGIRLDLYSEDAMHDLGKQIDLLRYYCSRVAPWGWSVGFLQLNSANWEPLADIIPSLPADIVVDHCALLKAASMLPSDMSVKAQPGMAPILRLLNQARNFWVKISAPYRCSDSGPIYEDMQEVVRALLDANPGRIVWGSDWPHTPRMQVRSKEEALRETPYLQVDDRCWLESLKDWLSEKEWRAIMVENPRRLFRTGTMPYVNDETVQAQL